MSGNVRGPWVMATVYARGDVVSVTGASYIEAQEHVSGVFATDLAAGKWLPLSLDLVGDITLAGNNTFRGDNTFSGANDFSGANTFSGDTTLSGGNYSFSVTIRSRRRTRGTTMR